MLGRYYTLLLACYIGLVHGAAHHDNYDTLNEIIASAFTVHTVILPVEQNCQVVDVVVPFITGSVREKQHLLASLLSLKSRRKQFDGIVGFAYGPSDQGKEVRLFAKSIEQGGYIDESNIPEGYGCELYTMSKTKCGQLSIFQGADKVRNWCGILVPMAYQSLLEQVAERSADKTSHELIESFKIVANTLCEQAEHEELVHISLVEVPVLVRSDLRLFNERLFG